MKDYVDYIFHGTHNAWYVSILMPWIVKKFGIRAGSKVLDVGCGNGDGVNAFRNCGMQAVGADRHPSPFSVEADIEKHLPFPDNTFDMAFNKSVIEHVFNPAGMVDEIYRVLKPGGKVIILSPDMMFGWRGFWHDCTHYWGFTNHSIKMLLDLHGFRETTKELMRPSGHLMKHPFLRPFIIALTYVLPYWWLGPLRYAKRGHIMSLVSGTK
jgi:SAM-dependent methyltransferase